ncbi:hypothetical protein [Nocardioides dilutus]
MIPTPTPTPPVVMPSTGSAPTPTPSLDPSSADWWWQYGLDGIVGGILGGAVTALAVVLTIRHERGLVRDQEIRSALVRLHDLSLRFSLARVSTPPIDGDFDPLARDLLDISREVSTVIAVIGGRKRLQRLVEEIDEWDNAMLAAMTGKGSTHARSQDTLDRSVALARRVADWLLTLEKGGPAHEPGPGWPKRLDGNANDSDS